MLKTAQSLVKNVLNVNSRWICRREFATQAFKRFNERPVELAFVFRKLAEVYPRKILDVGSGTTALPHLMRNCGFLVTATDNVREYWPSGMVNRHYHVVDDDITNTEIRNTFDLITCISVLEHIEQADAAMRNLFSLLNENGDLLVTFPYSERSYVRNVYELPGSTYGQQAAYITQSYSRTEVEQWLHEYRGTIMEQEYWEFWEGEHWTVGNQVIPPRRVSSGDRHQLTCIHIRKR